jgi:hypothetical protein
MKSTNDDKLKEGINTLLKKYEPNQNEFKLQGDYDNIKVIIMIIIMIIILCQNKYVIL